MAAQIRFAYAENHQGRKFQARLSSVDEDVERDQALEAKARHSAHPVAQSEIATQGPSAMSLPKILATCRPGPWPGQARIAHHQRVEHAEGAEHSAEDQAMRNSGPPSIPAMSPTTVSHAPGGNPVIHTAATGKM